MLAARPITAAPYGPWMVRESAKSAVAPTYAGVVRWVFTSPHPGDSDFKFRHWAAANPDLFVVVSERRPRPSQVQLHRAGCARLSAREMMPVGKYLRTCGSRETLEDAFSDSEVVPCQACQ